MDKSMKELPEPQLKKIKISVVKKTIEKDLVHTNYLDTLLDKKFIKTYFAIKNN
jgi:hypothetical protein|tara:strand:- start:306 stop:467 length:162 start_codon:yes stop_codon:yes gene_type:complete